MAFLKPEPLKTEGNLCKNFNFFKDEIEFYLSVNEHGKKSREEQVKLLKGIMGKAGWDLYCKLEPKKQSEKEETVESILCALQKHCDPNHCSVMNIFNFLYRKQLAKESFKGFLEDLKCLAKLCNFGGQEDKLIRYQIVMGVYSTNLQTRLLQKDFSLDETIRIASSAVYTDFLKSETSYTTSEEEGRVDEHASTRDTDKLF